MTLWAVMVGGTFPGVRLESHDILFAIGETIEACIPALRRQWRGEPASLHLDAWGKLDGADGHRIDISDTPPAGPRVWFVHVGGYDPDKFTELHDNVFVVARTVGEAKARAVGRFGGWHLPHRDAQLSCDSVEDITGVAGGRKYLNPVPCDGAGFRFRTDYVPVGVG